MARGYMEKILFVDLARREVHAEELSERLRRQFIGGYGLGARIIYGRQRPGIDPLGPENILGFVTGPLTGTPVPFGTRYAVVVGKSPLTGGWGDSNSGGDFGSFLKFSGYDGIFFTGVSEEPVFLFIKDGEAELRDASHLWGKDIYQTEKLLKLDLGNEIKVAAIGPAGERLSLISSIINDKTRAAARSGVGAVMGSKKLKAIALKGSQKIEVPNRDTINQLRKKYIAMVKGPVADLFRTYGTAGSLASAVRRGDCPVKNWSGVGSIDFPNADLISDVSVINLMDKRSGCYRCPLVCSGYMKAGTEYKYARGVKKPEYETLGAFGPLCLNDNLESIIAANDICNRYGLDTISTGATIAFAMECYENGIITKRDTDGIDLDWGNHKAIVHMTEKIAKREGFGNVLADGVRKAAERIGQGAEAYAIHCHGQEPPMHDPKFAPSYATSYQSDPTPGRHMQRGLSVIEGEPWAPGLRLPPLDKYIYEGKGKYERILRNESHLINAAGMCFFAHYVLPWGSVRKFISAVTGWDFTPMEFRDIAERIAAIRQAFNLREGLSPKDFKLPGRMIGKPPLKKGPTANITVDADTLCREYYLAMRWDPVSGKPDKKRLLELQLDDVAADLWA